MDVWIQLQLTMTSLATCDDGSCIVPQLQLGCTDSTACNYDATATTDDGSCEWTSCVGCSFDPVTGLGCY